MNTPDSHCLSNSRPSIPPGPVESDLEPNMIYTIIVRGERFHLSHEQISFDSPNYFTDCFASGFAEAQQRVLRLSRNPIIFALIFEYLSGYSILPLTADILPHGKRVGAAMRWLHEDAQFYDLKMLQGLLSAPPILPPEMDLSWAGYGNEIVTLEQVLESRLPAGVARCDDGTLISVDGGGPVLVVAKDVCFRVVHSSIVTGPRPFDSEARRVALEIALPSHSTTLCQAIVRMHAYDEQCHISADAMPYKAGDLLNGFADWPTIRATPTIIEDTSARGPRLRRVVYTFWAKKTIFALCPADAAVSQADKAPALCGKLVMVSLRSKQAVFGKLGSLC